LSQSTRLLDGRTDGQTDSFLVASPRWHSMECGKNWFTSVTVRFKSGSGMAISCIRNVFDHDHRNSSVIVNLAVGQISRSTERICSLFHISTETHHHHHDIIGIPLREHNRLYRLMPSLTAPDY